MAEDEREKAIYDYDRRKNTLLTDALALWRRLYGNSPSQGDNEMLGLLWILGAPVAPPEFLAYTYVRSNLQLKQRRRVYEVGGIIARNYGWSPTRFDEDTGEDVNVNFPLSIQTFMKELQERDMETYFPSGWDVAYNQETVTDPETGETTTQPSWHQPLLEGDLLYGDFKAVLETILEGPLTPGQLEGVRHFFWNSQQPRRWENFLEITTAIDSLGGNFDPETGEALTNMGEKLLDTLMSKGVDIKKSIDSFILLEKSKDINMSPHLGLRPATLEDVTKGTVNPKGVDLWVKTYELFYGELPTAVNQAFKSWGKDSTTFPGRDEIQEEFGRTVSNRIIRILALPSLGFPIVHLGPHGAKRLQWAFDEVFGKLLRSGAIPKSSLQTLLSDDVVMNIQQYVTTQVALDPDLARMDAFQVVDFLLPGVADGIRAHEIEKRFGIGGAIHKRLSDKVDRMIAEDPAFSIKHVEAFQMLKAKTPALLDDILLQRAAHNQHEDMLTDSALESGLPEHKRVDFDIDAAMDTALNESWAELSAPSLAASLALDAKTAKDERIQSDKDAAAVLAITEENYPGFNNYRDAAQLVWAHLGNDPAGFNADLLERFTSNGQNPDLALNSLSRELYSSGAFGTTEDFPVGQAPGATQGNELFKQFTGLLKTRETRVKSLKVLQQFTTPELAIASPIGRAALEAMAPGLTGEDQRQIDYIQGEMDKIAAGMEYAQYTPEEYQEQIDKIKARPAERLQAQLDQPRTMPGMMGEAQFGYDTGGIDIPQEIWANALFEKEKMRMAFDPDAFLASIPEDDRADILKFLAQEGGLAELLSMFERSFATPDRYYQTALRQAKEATGLEQLFPGEPGYDPSDPYETAAEWDERTRGEPDYVDPYPELTEAGTYEVSPGVTVTIPEGGKREVFRGSQEPGDYSRRVLLEQTEASESMKSVQRQKRASTQTFQQFVSTELPELMRQRAAKVAEFTGSKVRRTAVTGGRRVRF